MAQAIDITGKRFSRLTALRYIGSGSWEVKCDCGKLKTVRGDALRRGFTKSCGCLHLEQCKTGDNSRLHGDAAMGKVKRIHNIWRGLLSKCYRESSDRYKYYGARGIKVCPEWHEYIPFRDWAYSHGYNDQLTIHRKNNDGDYAPGNCEWATRKTQSRNTRRTHWVSVKGEIMSLAECAEKHSIPYRKLDRRLRVSGWSIERAILP